MQEKGKENLFEIKEKIFLEEIFQEIKDLIFNDMKQLEKANGLKGFEMVILH